jgi:DNA-binding MarR family transcriptional regulator
MSADLIRTELMLAAVPDEPKEDIAALAGHVRNAAGQLIRRVRHESGTSLTLSQSVLLSGLARRGRATASELAAENGLRAQTVWTSLATLERRGLVGRERDSADRRNVHVWLTGRGLDELAEDRKVRENWIVGVLADQFGPEERAVLAKAAPLIVRLATAAALPSR